MLSRVADALYWMSRYLERAEQTARLLDVSFHQELDFSALSGGEDDEFQDILAILQVQPPEGARSVRHWLTFELENPLSILACVNRARNNARSIRGAITTPIWRELNKLYWHLRDPEFSGRAMESPHEFYTAVEVGNHLFHGVCHATLPHDEGWRFIQLGMYLERAEKTLRILDVKYHQYKRAKGSAGLPVAHLRWAGVLNSCLAYEAYQRLYISRVEPERVVEFLLLNPEFPRSVRFSLEAASRALEELEGRTAQRQETRADRILGKMLAELRFTELGDLFGAGLHDYLHRILQSAWSIGQAIQQQYALS